MAGQQLAHYPLSQVSESASAHARQQCSAVITCTDTNTAECTAYKNIVHARHLTESGARSGLASEHTPDHSQRTDFEPKVALISSGGITNCVVEAVLTPYLTPSRRSRREVKLLFRL